MKNKKIEKIEHETGSGNVFADLGVANPEEALAKSDLALKIYEIISQKKLTQRRAAKLLGIDQPKISALINGKLAGFSLERLFRYLIILGQEITINIKPIRPSKKGARLHVAVPRLMSIEEPRTRAK